MGRVLVTGKKGLPEIPELPAGVGSVDDWAQFIGTDDATQMLAGLGALGGSQELLDQLTTAVLPAGGPALSGTLRQPDAAGDPMEELRRTELRFRSLVENLPCVAFVAGMGHGRNEVYVNPYIEQLLGYSQEEWLRDPFLWYWRLHADDRAAWNQEFARGLVTGGPWQADCRFLAADGRAVWVRGHARIVRDAEGRPLFLQGIAFDIDSIKAAEKRAQEQRDHALGVLDALPEALLVFTANDEVLAINAAARGLLDTGATPPGSMRALVEMAFGGTAPAVLDLAERARRTGTPQMAVIATQERKLQCECFRAPGGEKAGTLVLRLRA